VLAAPSGAWADCAPPPPPGSQAARDCAIEAALAAARADEARIAREIPTYNVDQLCRHQATLVTKVPDPTVQAACQREQQDSYDALKSNWDDIPPAARAKCDAMARSQNASGGFGDYSIMLDCAREALRAAAAQHAVESSHFQK
jgi:hypothetical protein